jgi:hypothetical protein
MKQLLTSLIVCWSLSVFSQQRLELLETNIATNIFSAYGDSYLWTKNWWLTNGMLVDTAKGGNSISAKSQLTTASIDSLSKLFRTFVSPNVMRFGNLVPRIIKSNTKSKTFFVKASIYEFDDRASKLIAQFIIEFVTSKHNKKHDVMSIIIVDPGIASPLPLQDVKNHYNRKANKAELDITPPGVANK